MRAWLHQLFCVHWAHNVPVGLGFYTQWTPNSQLRACLQPIDQRFHSRVLKFLYMMYPYESVIALTFGIHRDHNVPVVLCFYTQWTPNSQLRACLQAIDHRFHSRALKILYMMYPYESSIASTFGVHRAHNVPVALWFMPKKPKNA